jgi:starch phosphorylase
MVLADFAAYAAKQDEVDAAFRNHDDWTRRAAFNVVRMGQFSSDRTIREYADGIWGVKPCPVATPRDPSLVPNAHPDLV